jgi:hypothetical protein
MLGMSLNAAVWAMVNEHRASKKSAFSADAESSPQPTLSVYNNNNIVKRYLVILCNGRLRWEKHPAPVLSVSW